MSDVQLSTEYLSRELRDLLDASATIVRSFQRGASMTSRGVSITILEKNPEGLSEFWDKIEALRLMLVTGVPIGAPCGLTDDARKKCPNMDWWDGDETFSFRCDVCGVKGCGEHPQ